MPRKFPYIVDGYIGDVPVNWYPAADSERGVILHGTPGRKSICTLTDCTEIRGLYAWNSYLYAVARRGSESVLWRVDPAGGFAELGTITTSFTGPVWIVNNYTQLLITDGVTGYVYTPSTNIFVEISDPNFPGAGACDYQDGYGLFNKPNSIQWFFSHLLDFTIYNALDFYSKEGRPDNILSILSDHREVWLFGAGDSTEVWYHAGGPDISPTTATFARVPGGLLEYGCGAAKSPVNFDNSVVWLSNKGQLLRAVGYSPTIISTDMFERDIKTYPKYDDAVAFAYTEEGHTFYQASFPSANKTWVYDAKTKLFHKRSGYLDDGSGYGRDRANCYALLNNKHYVGDYTNGKIYEQSMDYYDDDGHPIQSVLHSQEVGGGLKRIFFPSVQIIFEAGVGLESGLDPQVMLQYSNDGGHTWSNEAWRSMGKIGEYTKQANWHRQGSDFRRMYRLTITSAVKRKILGVGWGFK